MEYITPLMPVEPPNERLYRKWNEGTLATGNGDDERRKKAAATTAKERKATEKKYIICIRAQVPEALREMKENGVIWTLILIILFFTQIN